VSFPVVESTAESSTNTAGTSHTVTLPSGIVASDLVLIVMDIGSTSATLNALTDWGEILDEASANGLKILRYTGAGVPSNPTFTSSANTRDASISFRISGANKAIAPEIGSTGTGTSATPDPPASAAPGSTKDYLFIAFAGMAGEEADDDTWGNTPPTNYTPSPPLQKSCGTAGTNLGGLIVAAHRQLNTGSAENPGTFGVDTSAAWRAQTIMVHPIVDTTVTPTTLALTISTFAPTVTATNNVRVTPTTQALTLATFAPTVLAPRVVTPPTTALVIATFAPSVTVGVRVTPPTLALITTGLAPTVSTPRLVMPAALTLTVATFAPTVQTPRLATPGTAALALSTFAPTVGEGGGVTVTPGTLALTISTFAPAVSAPRLATPGTLALTLSAFAPAVSAPRLVTPGTLVLAISAFAPAVTTPRLATPGTLVLTMPTFAPTVRTPRLVTPATAVLELSTFAPTFPGGGSLLFARRRWL